MEIVGEVGDMEEGKVAMMMETTGILEDTTEMMEDKALLITEEGVEDIMIIDLKRTMDTIEEIMIMDGEVKGMEEEMVNIGEEDIRKIMGTLVIEVGRENMEEEDMVEVEVIADQMTEDLVVEEAVVDFRRGHLMAVGSKDIEFSFLPP